MIYLCSSWKTPAALARPPRLGGGACRDAGKRVLDILARRARCERASIDEAYLDLTAEAQRTLAAGEGAPPPLVNPGEAGLGCRTALQSACICLLGSSFCWNLCCAVRNGKLAAGGRG